jgi:hypothetical protein
MPDRPAPPRRRSVSANCRNDHSGPCLGCGCECHDIPAPDLRELAGLPPKPEPEEDR